MWWLPIVAGVYLGGVAFTGVTLGIWSAIRKSDIPSLGMKWRDILLCSLAWPATAMVLAWSWFWWKFLDIED